MLVAIPEGYTPGTDGKRDGTDEVALSDAQTRRFRAMIEGNYEDLGDLLAEDLVYVHTTGAADTKERFIDHQTSGDLRYETIEPEEPLIRTYGPAGVVTGTARMGVRIRGESRSFRIRFTDVYNRTEEGWKLVAWQSTRLPEED